MDSDNADTSYQYAYLFDYVLAIIGLNSFINELYVKILEILIISFYMPKKQPYKGAPPVKKTGSTDHHRKLKHEQRFDGVAIIPLIAPYYERIKKKIDYLSKVLLRQSIIWNKGFASQNDILRNYVQHYHEYYEFNQFDSQFSLLPSLDVNLYTLSNAQLLYKSCNIFKSCAWAVRFGAKFTSRVVDYQANQIYYILSFIMLLADGNFYTRNTKDATPYGYVESIEHRVIPHNRYFKIKIFREKTLLFNVGVEKIPIVKQGIIKRYEYRNYLQFLDILSDQIAENHKKLHEAVDRFTQIISEDVAKKDHSDQLLLDMPTGKNRRKQEEMFEESVNPYTGLTQIFEKELVNGNVYVFKPLIFKPHYVSSLETSTLVFNKELNRWVSSDYITKKEMKAFNEYQKKINDEMIKRFLDFKSAKTLVQLLTKIPNFRVSLTEQEKDVIGENGNVLVIGRSGTGKTTCAVLRLFAIQMLFKIRLSLFKKKFKSEIEDTRCSADDIDQSMGLHCIFLTASPVLINQIQRYYKKLTDNIKNELQKKRKKSQDKNKAVNQASMKKSDEVPEIVIAEKKDIVKEEQIKEKEDQEQEIVEVPEKLIQVKSKQEEEQEQEMNEELGDITLQDNQGQNQGAFEQEDNVDNLKDEFQEKMRKYKSLEDLTETDYPGFFTVKSFLMMVDATLKKPFFIRKKEEKTESESQATWHNEKKGVMMIENYYRNDENDEIDNAQLAEQIEEQINYSDEQELEHEYMRQIQLRQNREKQKLTEKLNKNKKALSFEVDYDYFYNYFWPTVRHRHFSARNITPHLVWTEIYSTIKGGASSHLYPGLNLPEQVYIRESTNVFLTKEQKLDIFETYCQYERWKIRSGGYDLMDAVNYVLNYFRFRGYEGPDIHYIMIDEVQDLPHAIIYLLSKTVRYGVFYSGDTAQTIAKGIGFRFCDLKNLFDPRQFDSSLTLAKPIVKQLTINFRSHNNILQLANSVVSSIQILFPKTIDRLNKEVSNIKGPKPMILAESDEELLFYVLCGDQSYKKANQKQQSAMKKPPLEFGCDQVIIVRDQESKNRIPSMLQHALCLTIYEAKGLQFNDVILFNFFDESKCRDKWNLIKFLKVIIKEMDRSDYERSVTKHPENEESKEKIQGQMMEGEDDVEVDAIVDGQQNSAKVFIKKIVSDSKIYMKDINDYAELCSELKMLYTAITRPRKTLILYDEDSTPRKPLERLWEKLEVVELVSKEILNEENKKNNETEEIKIFKSIINSTNSSQWKKQGLRMFNRGYFEQAMKCFHQSGDQDLFRKAEANMIADTASKRLIEIQSQRNAIKNHMIQYQKMSESDLSKLKKKLKREEASCYVKFTEAGYVFEELLLFKQAGQCYFSGKMFQKAYESFIRAFMYKQAAQSLEMLNKYREAAELYQKDDNYLKLIECLDLVNEWEIILHKIQKFSHMMTEVEKQSLFKKYSALALQELVYEIEFENEVENEQKPENQRIDIIKEEEDSENEDDWDEDDDPELAAEKYLRKRSELLSDGDKSDSVSRKMSGIQSDIASNEKPERKFSVQEEENRRKHSLIEEDKIIQESVYENIEDKHEETEVKKEQEQNKEQSDSSSFADLNDSAENEQSMKKDEEIPQENIEKKEESIVENLGNSFADIVSEQSSFADLNAEEGDQINIRYPAQLQPDIESIRSMADSEDPWLRSAISEINAKTQTEYSIIDESENYNPNVRIIKTKGNIFVQDEIMKKIVSIVSIVNSSVEEFFKHFKGYQSLITVSKEQMSGQIIDNRPEIFDFEDIDPEFINIILDTLESFKLHKLCLFVCNRYHMPHKAGRYLLSMALKYSTNAYINNKLNPSLISPSINRKSELQKGILASIALHALFENVSADFLKVKVSEKEQNKNTLGTYFVEGLVLEGIYKKAVFIVNSEESLKLLWNFSDFEIYHQIFKQRIKKLQPEVQLDYLPIAPQSPTENSYTIMKMESMLYDFHCITKSEFISQRFYREFDVVNIKNNFHRESVPEYLPYLSALFSEDNIKITEMLTKNINQAYNILKKGSDYQIYDIVAFLITMISKEGLYAPVFSLDHSDFLEIYRCIHLLRQNLYAINLTKTSLQILQSIFSAFTCKIIVPCKSMKFISDGFSLIKRTTVFCNSFVEQTKKDKDECAFFFEQDYNQILVNTEKLLKLIRRKFDLGFAKFLRHRSLYETEIRAYLYEDFKYNETEHLLKLCLREEEKYLSIKKNKKYKQKTISLQPKKKERPKFSYKNQGRPDLVLAFDSEEEMDSEEQVEQKKNYGGFKFTFPDLHPKLHYLYDIIFTLFHEKSNNNKDIVTGELLYCSGLNDAYKEYTHHKGGYNLYDAIEFRKFNRIDLYADNILSVITDIPVNQKSLIICEILLNLLIQYKLFDEETDRCKIDVTRDYLKFFPDLKLVETQGKQELPQNVSEIIENNLKTCIFEYQHKYGCELTKAQIADLMCEFLDIIRIDESYKNVSVQNLMIVFLVNMPYNAEVYETLRLTVSNYGNEWSNPIFQELKFAKDLSHFSTLRAHLLSDKEKPLQKYTILHQLRVTDISDLDKCIKDSEIDYEIKEKILEARKKAAVKISTWWRMVKKREKPKDQDDLIAENRMVKVIYKTKDLPCDDRLLLRTNKIRNILVSFYLSKVVTFSLDFHFILMTLNKIQELREKYIRAYSEALIEVDDTDFEAEISGIEQTVDVWKKDSKWLKERNMDLKRKKVFEVKWMTKNNIHSKIIRKRAGLKKQKNLELKKKMLKRR